MCCLPEGSPNKIIQNLVIGIRIVWFSMNRLLDDKYNLKKANVHRYYHMFIPHSNNLYNTISQWFLIPNSINEIILLAFPPIIPHYVSLLHYGIVVIVWWKKTFENKLNSVIYLLMMEVFIHNCIKHIFMYGFQTTLGLCILDIRVSFGYLIVYTIKP